MSKFRNKENSDVFEFGKKLRLDKVNKDSINAMVDVWTEHAMEPKFKH